MATYMEIKQFIKEVFALGDTVNEESDLSINGNDGEGIVLPNELLKQDFERMLSYKKDKLVMYSDDFRESCISHNGPGILYLLYGAVLEDIDEGIEYKVGWASNEYCLFLLSELIDYQKQYQCTMSGLIRIKTKRILSRHNDDRVENPAMFLSRVFGIVSLKVKSKEKVDICKLRGCADAYRFLCMYRKNISLVESSELRDIFPLGGMGIFRNMMREDIDSSPKRVYNSVALDYYTVAIETKDPFVMYISFYHVVEYYFDEIYKKKLVSNIKERITHPGFSYKRDDDIYGLAKYIKKHINFDNESGKGNELDSLYYVLQEYVDIDELKNRINMFDNYATDYYRKNFVPFTTSQKTKIVWNDIAAVHKNIATRIYETRNALVHSKSEQLNNQYKPYENKNDLFKEIPLIRAVAEAVLIGTSKEI